MYLVVMMMTIKKQWIAIILFSSVFSIFVNTIVLNQLTQKSFNSYVARKYENHVNQVLTYVERVLNEESYLENQVHYELETHIIDPIISISFFDVEKKYID
jgi:hypothetical protein